MRDVTYDPEAEKKFECVSCGRIATGQSPPAICADCGDGRFMNRGMPFE